MMAEPNAMSHGLITAAGGAFVGAFLSKSAAKPETVEQPRASAAAHAIPFIKSPALTIVDEVIRAIAQDLTQAKKYYKDIFSSKFHILIKCVACQQRVSGGSNGQKR